MPDELTVSVSVHAKDRWRKRGAEYADCSSEDLAQAYREATPVDHPGPARAKMPNHLYRLHPSGCVFVAKPDGPNSVRIRTVLPPDSPVGGARSYLLPKSKRHPARPEAQPPELAVGRRIELVPDLEYSTERVKRKAEKVAQKQVTKLSNVKRIELLEAELAAVKDRLAAHEAMLRGEDPQQPTSEEKFREPTESGDVGETITFGRSLR